MSTTHTPATSTTGGDGAGIRVPLEDIQAGENARELDPAHVDGLAQSIALRGLLVPLIVRPTPGGYQLVAGHHRLAACRQLGHPDVPVIVRENEGSSADSAVENVTRKQLNPLQEARAVQAMLDDGFTLAGAAQALGWSAQLVSARARLLELPEAGQQLVGAGEIPVSAVEHLLELAAVSRPLADAAIRSVTTGHYDGALLARDPAWAIHETLRRAPKTVFAVPLTAVQTHDVARLRLGKKITALVDEAARLHKQADRYAYGTPQFRFTEPDVDQARAAGALVEFPGSHRPPIVTDQAVYRELVKNAITRTVTDLRARAAANAKSKRGPAARGRSPRAELDTQHRANLRALAARAHNTNLDLGAALIRDLTVADPADLDVAKFMAYGLLGPDRTSHHGGGDAARAIAANGLALVLPEHRTTTTPRLKSGKRGKTKVTYTDPEAATQALWRFVDAARTAGELYGRVLLVFAAQHYAQQLALPGSKRRSSALPPSRNDIARKAFERATKRVVPATHKALAKAIEDEAKTYHDQVDALEQRQRATPTSSPPDDIAPREGDDRGELDDATTDDALDPAHGDTVAIDGSGDDA